MWGAWCARCHAQDGSGKIDEPTVSVEPMDFTDCKLTTAEPDADWLNDSTRPLIHAIAPRAAAQLALRTAEETDALAARLPLDRLWPTDPDSPISPARGEHRGEHLDEIEAALRAGS